MSGETFRWSFFEVSCILGLPCRLGTWTQFRRVAPPWHVDTMLFVYLVSIASFSYRQTGAPKAIVAYRAAAGRSSRRHMMLAEGLPKAVVFDLDGCLWAPDMCAWPLLQRQP